MSQKNNVVNFLIQDTNGQPKVVKVLQSSSQAMPQMKIKPTPVKLYKLPIGDIQSPSPVYRTVKINSGNAKVVHLPIHSLKNIQNSVTDIKQEATESDMMVKSEPQYEIEFDNEEEILSDPLPTPTTPSKHKVSPAPPPLAYHRRKLESRDMPEYTTKRRKMADKIGKGLRHFSMKVCEKVRTKGFTSYNEVADELVAEFAAGIHGSAESQQYDQKNIRRRVYDALNVLMAMNIISKEKKEIRWLGLPTNTIQECSVLEKEKQEKLDSIKEKSQELRHLILQHITFKNLIERNSAVKERGETHSEGKAIQMPFFVINTTEDAIVQCGIAQDKTAYKLHFDKSFHINQEVDILKHMGMLYGLDTGKCSRETVEKAKNMLPKSLQFFVDQLPNGEESFSELYEEEDTNGDESEDSDDEPATHDDDHYSDDSSDVDV